MLIFYLTFSNFAQSTASPYIKNICDRHGNSDCGVWLADIEDGFQLILSLTRPIAGGTIAVDATGRLDINSRDAAQTIASAEWDIEKALGLMNYTFESHELVPNPNIGIKLNNDTPAMTHHHRLAGVQHSESTVPRDYNLYRYNDGAAQLHLSPASLNNSTSTVQKRKAHNGPGIKISFDHRAFGITKSYIKPAANKMADDWLKSVQGNHADTYAKVSEKIKSKWIDIVQYRTILESGGFGENYESVHNCDSKK